jgi:hypothetical protein
VFNEQVLNDDVADAPEDQLNVGSVRGVGQMDIDLFQLACFWIDDDLKSFWQLYKKIQIKLCFYLLIITLSNEY